MRHALLAATLFLLSATYAQEDYRKILRTDPYLSNGYFIVDPDDWQQLDISHIDVDIILATPNTGGATTKETIQSFTIEEPTFGKADLGFLSTLEEDQFGYYRLRAFDHSGNEPVDIEGFRDCVGCEPWPLVCRQVCNAPAYAWSLDLYSDGGQSQIEMHEGTNEGMYFYFYVKDADWQWFRNHYSTSAFGLPGSGDNNGWNGIMGSDYCFHVSSIPDGGRNVEGISYGIGVGSGWAIAKGRGEWSSFLVSTDVIGTGNGDLCQSGDYLRQVFNSDALVQFTLSQNQAGPVTCTAMIDVTSGGNTWTSGSSALCTSWTINYEHNGDEIDIISWASEVVNCPTFVAHRPEAKRPFSVEVIHHHDGTSDPVVAVLLPSEKDPKLIPFPKTELAPGLYEYRVILDDGSIIRHFEDYDQTVVLNADFASFSIINIYPVPVKDSFSVDFDLMAPMDIDMTIVNNTGEPYFQKNLNFPLAGRNKFVVDMDQQWPGGIYHAIFQYADGSSESMNFNVVE